MVQNGWKSVERRWNVLGEVQAEVSGPISRTWVPLNLTQERPKWPILAQNGQKWQFQGFGGPKRLGQPRTKVEWVEGNPSRSFWTHSTFVPRCSNRFRPQKPRNLPFFGHFGPILAISGAPGSNLGAPCCTKLVHKLRHGPPLTCSTFVPCCSNRFRPPELEIAIFGHFWPIWAIMGAPGPYLGAPCCSKLVQKHWLGPPLTCSTFVPRCSHGF